MYQCLKYSPIGELFKPIVEPIIGNYGAPYRISEFDFEKDFRKKVDKICAVQHCNIGGEYWINHFYLDGNIYILETQTNHWDNDSDFKKEQIKEFVWLIRKRN